MVEAPIAPAPGPVPSRIGRYEVLCELGQGGMAVLYLARSVGLGGFERLFAIKMIHEHLGREPGFVRMFLDEARLVARIRHPNVIPVYEVDVDRGRYYISMDYFSGETFGAALTATWPNRKPFSTHLAAHVVALACEGLHAAHELRGPNGVSLGVIHRDISPQNIMLGYDGTVRVMDFGVAKALDQLTQSRPGSFKGTPAYMSPEQIRGGSMDRRSDVFGLGVILWEATIGKRLFKDKNDISTAARVIKMKIPPPSSISPGYPSRLEEIILKAVSREPSERHQTARELADDLQEFLAGSGKRVSPGDLERFMIETFPTRLRERRELEHRAMQPVPLNLTLPSRDLSESLAAVDLDEDLDFDFEANGVPVSAIEAEEPTALRASPTPLPSRSATIPINLPPRPGSEITELDIMALAPEGDDEPLDVGTGLVLVSKQASPAQDEPAPRSSSQRGVDTLIMRAASRPGSRKGDAPETSAEEPITDRAQMREGPIDTDDTAEVDLGEATAVRAPNDPEPGERAESEFDLVVPVGPPLKERKRRFSRVGKPRDAIEEAALGPSTPAKILVGVLAVVAVVLIALLLRGGDEPSSVAVPLAEPIAPPSPEPASAQPVVAPEAPTPAVEVARERAPSDAPSTAVPAGAAAVEQPVAAVPQAPSAAPKVRKKREERAAPAEPAEPTTPRAEAGSATEDRPAKTTSGKKRKGTSKTWKQPRGATLFNGSDL